MKWVQELSKRKFKQKGGESNARGPAEETAESDGEVPSQAEGALHLPASQQLRLNSGEPGPESVKFSGPLLSTPKLRR